MDAFEKMLEKHTQEEEKKFNAINSQLEIIRVNHLAHIEQDLKVQRKDMATIKADYAWLRWIVTTTLGAVMVGLVAGIMNLIIK
jgi:hypothetical protein